MAKMDLLQGALLVVEAVAAAGALAAVNSAKSNTTRGTYAFMVKKDANGVSLGTGGVDLDVALGASLVLIAAIAPPAIAPHLAALGAGGLACYGARAGNKYGAKRAGDALDAKQGVKRDAAGNIVSAIPGHTGYGSLSGYAPRFPQPMGQIDPYASGFANAQPVYAPPYQGRPVYAGEYAAAYHG